MTPCRLDNSKPANFFRHETEKSSKCWQTVIDNTEKYVTGISSTKFYHSKQKIKIYIFMHQLYTYLGNIVVTRLMKLLS